jgi:hypothetical protein
MHAYADRHNKPPPPPFNFSSHIYLSILVVSGEEGSYVSRTHLEEKGRSSERSSTSLSDCHVYALIAKRKEKTQT